MKNDQYAYNYKIGLLKTEYSECKHRSRTC